jgi:hypothetical protein
MLTYALGGLRFGECEAVSEAVGRMLFHHVLPLVPPSCLLHQVVYEAFSY